MKQRVLTATVLCSLIIPILFFGSYFVVALVMFLSFRGVYELLKMHNTKKQLPKSLIYVLPIVTSLITGLAAYLFYDNVNLLIILLPIIIIYFVVLLIIGTFSKKILMKDIINIIFYIIYGGLSFSFLAGLRFITTINNSKWSLELGSYDINLIGLAIIGYSLIVSSTTDVGAQIGGMIFGKHKLCPTISPKKTVEGFICGMLTGGILGTLTLGLCQYFGDFYILPINNFFLNIIVIFIISLILSVSGQVGDLVASKIKREYEIKDYGKIFPGHGGVLDRFDSSILVTTMLFVSLLIIMIITGNSLW